MEESKGYTPPATPTALNVKVVLTSNRRLLLPGLSIDYYPLHIRQLILSTLQRADHCYWFTVYGSTAYHGIVKTLGVGDVAIKNVERSSVVY